ncbi:acyl-CoA synthetase [Pedomonas mirosovicensis]|uniref:acyl-CoA synthetase n=1 Tax=Pedomonas mirosovicensis TaxID=2908641 RepID=UPI002168CED9|nr:long-chain fatty acid--CoA ligase [Pedomonas mirosovicensis]MCH8683974.1 long-chain fatty acid--CoA ligase [Pedomonas mirosovicensis]
MAFDLIDITAKRAALGGGRTALVDVASGRSVTYAGLDERAARAASLLADLGVARGDRVAVLCRNRIAFFELLFGCAKLGAILVPLNWRMPPRELGILVADCAPALLVYGREDEAAARAVAGSIPSLALAGGIAALALDDDGPGGYEARLAACPPAICREVWLQDEVWVLIYTSGTTGAPKAVMQTYGMALANYVNLSQAIDLRQGETTLNFLPLFHTAGINLYTLPVLMSGGQVLVMPGFDVDRLVDLLADGRLDTIFAVPSVYQQLSLHPRFNEIDLSRVRHWGCGGAPLSDALVRLYLARGVRVCNGMGMTETGPTAFLMDPENAPAKVGSVGKPQLLCQVKIVDADGQEVPQGERGEIWFRGPGITPGYWGKPAETASAFAPQGWLRSGDLGWQDADGYYYVTGRIKDMFISGGENVYPAEVENVLVQHPAVLEAAVVGVPDARWGEAGRAFLLLRPGAAPPSEAELAAFCRERLAAYKVPKSFCVLPDFPRTAAGKIQKHLLRQEALAS